MLMLTRVFSSSFEKPGQAAAKSDCLSAFYEMLSTITASPYAYA